MKRLPLFAVLLLLTSCHAPRVITVDSKESPISNDRPPARQTAEKFEELNYLVYLPDGYDKERKPWPLILYLHGGSLRGNDLEKLKQYGLAAQLERNLSIPFVVISPQCPENRNWVDEEQSLVRLINDVSSKYTIDSDRIYVTGHSLGGRGAWYLGAKHAEKFAALVPMSDAPPDTLAQDVAKLPIWAFHGAKDELVPVARMRLFVKLVEAADGDIRYTELPEGDHYILDTYDNREIYDWMLQHQRK